MVFAAPRPEPTPAEVARGLLRCVARGDVPQLSWLDGGAQARSVVGVRPVEEVRSDDVAVLRDLPRDGYWIGWISYEAGVDAALGRAPRARELSGLCLRRFDGLLTFGPGGVASLGDAAAAKHILDEVSALGSAPEHATPTKHAVADRWPLGRLEACVSAETYRTRVRAALEEIRAGNTYQVNLSAPLRARWHPEVAGASFGARVARLYGALRSQTPASMGGLLCDGTERALVSNSPETLVERRGAHVSSSPIKGTRPRGRSAAEDRELADALLDSTKDAAEHVMIVDLVRNDLGRIAAPGSVKAPQSPELVTLPTVHHLVSRVEAKLSAQTGVADLFAALYPGGSITGAPKHRTLRIIESLETHPRGIYCGALVLITPSETIASIAIRSGVCDAAGITVHGGGGIVVDSDPEDERLEALAKVRAFDRAR